MPQVVSTLSSDVKYTLWKKKPAGAAGGPNVEEAHVTIRGGHGVAIRHPHGGITTPNGMITGVTEEQLALLKANHTFNIHLKNGFVRVIETDRKVEPEKAAKDLEAVEPSSPLTDKDFKEGGRAEAPKELKLSLGKGRSR